MGHNEAGVISVFKDALREFAAKSNRDFKDYPLAGQDRYTLADDLWRTDNHFAIVESKWSQNQLSSEFNKIDRVKALCEGLRDDSSMDYRHEQCHRIAWREEGTGRLMSRVYRDEICFEIFPNTCTRIDTQPDAMTIDDFEKKFFGKTPSLCLHLDEFITYIRWLTKVVTGEEREILVLSRSIDQKGCTIAMETTLDNLHKLLPEPPTPKIKFK